ncbi:class II aldolase/adducin family protein [Polaromonas sp. P1(28)-8]|nr:class II aldolase/adducin family protein [Polaromonas sp. P1(28)-8]
MEHRSQWKPCSKRPPARPSAQAKLPRVNLAALYRLAVKYGWDSHIFNHIAARVPGEECFLVKPHSLLFTEVRASNLLKLRLDGSPIDESSDVNAAGFTIHTAVLNSRPDINYTLHVHTNAES